ncbi:type II toxin-antitoxin system RelE/ParE family toxin [Nitrospiraceae bacterium AH_259_D15_M11_P09]|nr:type II toxin-antitoxin system RelE/ParE family toxin [Nitrospiraceae bacterium AH_259_D15_M11_P09]
MVESFIKDFPDHRERKKVLRHLKDMADHGPHPSRERFRVIDAGMFEIKSYQIRILGFFMPDDKILLTHGCVKKEDELDEEEIKRAKVYYEAYRKGLTSSR